MRCGVPGWLRWPDFRFLAVWLSGCLGMGLPPPILCARAEERSGQRKRACDCLSACKARVWAGPLWTRAPQVAPEAQRSAAQGDARPAGSPFLADFCLAGQKKCLARRGASRPPPLAKRAPFATASSFLHKASDLHKSGICSPLPTVALAFSRRKRGQIQKPFPLRKRFLCQRRLSPSPPSPSGGRSKTRRHCTGLCH